MRTFSLSPAAVSDGDAILPLAEAKAHLRIESGDTLDDDLVSALRDAAINAVEQYCGVLLSSRAVTARFDSFQAMAHGLGVRPVTAITTLTYLDSAGSTQTVASSVYRIAHERTLVLKPGQSWPGDLPGEASARDGAITLAFTAGYATPPVGLLAAVKMLLGHLFMNREAVITTGGAAGELPLGFTMLCDQHRDRRV